jgi:para-nitrobenzyl esterase
VAQGASRNIDLIAGHTRDEYRLFTTMSGLRGQVTAEMARHALDLMGPQGEHGDGEAAYRAAYPDADDGRLFELVHSDWLFRMPSLHLAQSHAAGGGRTYLYEVCYPAAAADLGACHAIDVPLVFGVDGDLRQMLFGPEPPAGAVALGNVMREQWAAFAATGDPGWPPYGFGRRTTRIFADPPGVTGYPELASLHLWDQHHFGVIDLDTEYLQAAR